MGEKTLLILDLLCSDAGRPRNRALLEAVLSNYPPAERPNVKSCAYDQLVSNPQMLAQSAVAWIFSEDEPRAELFELITRLQDSQIPALITRPVEAVPIASVFQQNVLIAPPDAPPVAICAMLRALWNQAEAAQEMLEELRVLRAHQGGLCVQMDKLDEELRLAARLQRELLPRTYPTIENFDFEVFFRPAGYVSGDIYDLCRLDERHVGIFVADAVGHGVPAALITVIIKNALTLKQFDTRLPGGYRLISPDSALAALNRAMIEQNGGIVRTATAWYGILDIFSLELNYARAGHPSPIVLGPDRTLRTLEADGPLLGVFEDESFELAKTRLSPGERLLVYSDGFELAFRQKCGASLRNITGWDPNFAGKFKDLGIGPLKDAVARLTETLDVQAGSLNQIDDLTLVCTAISEQHPAQFRRHSFSDTQPVDTSRETAAPI